MYLKLLHGQDLNTYVDHIAYEECHVLDEQIERNERVLPKLRF